MAEKGDLGQPGLQFAKALQKEEGDGPRRRMGESNPYYDAHGLRPTSAGDESPAGSTQRPISKGGLLKSGMFDRALEREVEKEKGGGRTRLLQEGQSTRGHTNLPIVPRAEGVF